MEVDAVYLKIIKIANKKSKNNKYLFNMLFPIFKQLIFIIQLI